MTGEKKFVSKCSKWEREKKDAVSKNEVWYLNTLWLSTTQSWGDD